MKDFKIGDTVICNISFQGYPQKGWKGKVINIGESLGPFYNVGVEWEEKFKWGHNCNGSGKYGYCRNYNDYYDTASSSIKVISKHQEQLELF